MLLLSGCGPIPAAAGEEPALLLPGRSFQGRFTDDPKPPPHAYAIPLKAGQYLHLSISQAEIDVFAELWSSRHQALLRGDSPRGADEHLFLVAPESGEYRLVVKSEEAGTAGAYSISVQTSQAPSGEDRLRAQAAGLSAEGEVCLKAGGYECARHRFEEALALWRRLGDPQAESEAQYKLGTVESRLGDHEDASTYWEQKVLPLWRGTCREPLLLNRMGAEVFAGTGTDPGTALRFHQQALDSAHAQCRSEEFRALLGLLEVYRSMGEVREGLNTFRTALGLARSERERSELLGTIGALLVDMGDLDRARQSYDKALERMGEGTGDKLQVLSFLGFTLCRMGDYSAGLSALDEALPLSSLFPRSDLRIHVLNNQGTCYVEKYERFKDDVQLLEKAERSFQEARELAKRADARSSEAIAVSYLGRILDLKGQGREAIDFFTHAYDLFPQDFRIGRAGALHGRARAWRGRRQLTNALLDIKEAIQLLDDLRAEAGSSRLRATFLSHRSRFYELEISLLAELDQEDPAGGYAARAFERSEAFRARTSLEELVGHQRVARGAAQDEDGGRLEEIQARLQQLHPLLQIPLDEAISYEQGAVAEEVRDLLIEWEILRAKTGGTSAGGANPVPLNIQQIRERLLDDETLIVAYLLGEDESFVWVVGRESVELEKLPGRRLIEDQANAVANLLAESHEVEKLDRLQLEAAKLSDLLLRPIAQYLGRHRLVILRDGDLYRIPFEALPDPRQPAGRSPVLLMDSNQVVYAPSASVLSAILERGGRRADPPKRLAAFGDAVFRTDDPRNSGKPSSPGQQGETRQSDDLRHLERLPKSGEEVREITRLLPEGEVLSLLGFEAKRARLLLPEMKQYKTIHIATHSRLDEAFPELSSLVFSMIDEAGQPQNGLLTFNEIANLELPVDMVVLSACRTALGEKMKGEGVIGLGRAFLHAGASRVVESLWDVDDEATAVLMQRFYEGMFRERLSPPEALRQARSFVRSQPQWQAPYYWAPFVLEGDWH